MGGKINVAHIDFTICVLVYINLDGKSYYHSKHFSHLRYFKQVENCKIQLDEN